MNELKATLTVLHGATNRLDRVLRDLGEAVADLSENGGDER